jgi:hypothetical protein
VNDKAAIATSFADDARIQKVIEAARSGDDPVGKQELTKQVQGKLPKKPFFAMYAYGDEIMKLASRASESFAGTPLQMKITSAQPFGMSMNTEGTSVRMDMYMPSELVQAIIDSQMNEAVKQEP